MLPNRCSISERGRQCPNPPEFIVTVTSDNSDEYMLGVTCDKHRQNVLGEVLRLQKDKKIVDGRVGFTPVKSVGTDCIRSDADEFVQIDAPSSPSSPLSSSSSPA